MTNSRFNHQILILAILCGIFTLVMFTGCVNGKLTEPQQPSPDSSGAMALDIRLGKVGLLAKRATIELEHLIIEISAKGSDSVVIADTSDLTGYGEKTVSKIFPDLAAPEDFTLSVTTVDAEGKRIHSGTADFTTIPADTVDVSVDLAARYSMLRVSFNDIPDSVNTVILGINEVDTLESTFTVGSNDTVVLNYDYLEADKEGIEYSLSLRTTGSFYGTDTVLYAADLTVLAKSGEDMTNTVVLNWVGPPIPDGAAKMTVTIGLVGTTRINAGFEERD